MGMMSQDEKLLLSEKIVSMLGIYGRTASVDVIDIWLTVLSEHDLREVLTAMSRYVGDPELGRYPPTPAGIRALLVPGIKAQALRAFDAVVDAIKAIGPYEHVAFDDPAIHLVVEDLGGWAAVNAWTDDDLKYRQNDFVARYEGHVRAPGHAHVPVLRGLASGDDVRRIGDADKASVVMITPKQDRVRISSWRGAGEVASVSTLRAIEAPKAGA
jgi:hypothetical protein